MEKDQLSRKLAVILHADVVDSTALVRLDETLAHERFQDTFRRFSKTISKHNGVAHELRGDALVAEFARASDAISASLDFQTANSGHVEELPDEIKPVVRIGIAMGEVIVADNTVTGEGIVLAQRLEQLADPGGICVQGAAYETIPKRLPFDYENLGERELKGFNELVRVYAVKRRSRPHAPIQQKASKPDVGAKPSIAVLPLNNMSGDPEQEYFSDGMTEDIITELTRFQSLFVIARNSSFAFKGQNIDVAEIGKKLGVQFVVEGSVRKAGERIRITVQLIEVSSGNHLWAERYDRDLTDIFAVQDDVVSQIVAVIPGQVDSANRIKAERKPVQDMNAYDLLLRAEYIMNWKFGSREVEQLLKRSLEIDPICARAHAELANLYAYGIFSRGQDVNEAARTARIHAETAMKLDPTDPVINARLAESYLLVGEHALAGHYIDKALALNPNELRVMVNAIAVKAYLGNYEAAIEWANRAARCDPYSSDAIREACFDAHYLEGQYELALEQMVGWQDHSSYIYLEAAAAYAQLGHMEEARYAVQHFEKHRPESWNTKEVIRAHARMCAKPEGRERWVEGFRKAGLEV